MATSSNRTIVILGAVFLAIIVVVIVIVALIPRDESAPDPVTVTTSDTTTESDVTIDTASTSTGFDLGVLNRRLYQLLNRQLVQEGAIPVQPPTVVGKANPFL